MLQCVMAVSEAASGMVSPGPIFGARAYIMDCSLLDVLLTSCETLDCVGPLLEISRTIAARSAYRLRTEVPSVEIVKAMGCCFLI